MRLSFIVANIVSAISINTIQKKNHPERPEPLVYIERAGDVEPAWATVTEDLDIRVRQSDGMSPHTRTDDSTESLPTGLVV